MNRDTLEARIVAIKADRELRGTNVHFLRADGTPDCYSYASAEKAALRREALRKAGYTLIEGE